MTASPSLAVFDVDGTLIDSQYNIITALTAAFEAQACPPPTPEAVRAVIGLSLDDLIARLLPDRSEATHRAIALGYRDAFFALRARPDHTERLFPGVVDAFDRLETAGWLLGVATGKSQRGVDALIEQHGFQGRFVTIQTADNNPSKPHPGMILQAMEEAGAASSHTVMVGDTSFDMEMARAAGARAIGVAWGYHPRSLLLAGGAQAVAEDFATLPQALETLVGRA